jgi:hypothetical protein
VFVSRQSTDRDPSVTSHVILTLRKDLSLAEQSTVAISIILVGFWFLNLYSLFVCWTLVPKVGLGFDPRAIHRGFRWHSETRTATSPRASVFPWHHQSTNRSYVFVCPTARSAGSITGPHFHPQCHTLPRKHQSLPDSSVKWFSTKCLWLVRTSHDHSSCYDFLLQTFHIYILSKLFRPCFGRCFRPSPGALDCIHSIWYTIPSQL